MKSESAGGGEIRPADRSSGLRLTDRLWSVRAWLKRWAAGLPSGAVFHGVPDDRFQARLSIYQWAAREVAGRRVLETSRGAGYGVDAVIVGGANEVETERRGRVDLLMAVDDVAGAPELGAADPSELAELLEPGGRILLAGGQYVRGSRYADASSLGSSPPHLERLAGAFLRRRRFLHLAPVGYRPRWHSRAPARARSHEYRFVEVGVAEAWTAETIGEVWLLSSPRELLSVSPLRLHVGAGMERLEGWLNVDLLPLPGVDLEMDVTREFPFEQVEAIYGEHFLEHLRVLQALDFFESAHRALRPQGRLRLSTPNLDWVWQTHYNTEGSPAKKVSAAFAINRAFYGWQHRFLWNRELLELALRSAGFADLDWPSYGESRSDELKGLERHERYPDSKQHQHVLIVDAVKGVPDPGGLRELRERFREELVTQIKGWQGVDLSIQKATPRADG